MDKSSIGNEELLGLTAEIVSSHVAHNNVSVEELPTLIGQVFSTLYGLGKHPAQVSVHHAPAVPVKKSINPDYIICLEDGKKLKMLKRHLRAHFDMSPEEYRARWNLPAEYPMVAPNYAIQRRELAKKIGLGRSRK